MILSVFSRLLPTEEYLKEEFLSLYNLKLEHLQEFDQLPLELKDQINLCLEDLECVANIGALKHLSSYVSSKLNLHAEWSQHNLQTPIAKILYTFLLHGELYKQWRILYDIEHIVESSWRIRLLTDIPPIKCDVIDERIALFCQQLSRKFQKERDMANYCELESLHDTTNGITITLLVDDNPEQVHIAESGGFKYKNQRPAKRISMRYVNCEEEHSVWVHCEGENLGFCTDVQKIFVSVMFEKEIKRAYSKKDEIWDLNVLFSHCFEIPIGDFKKYNINCNRVDLILIMYNDLNKKEAKTTKEDPNGITIDYIVGREPSFNKLNASVLLLHYKLSYVDKADTTKQIIIRVNSTSGFAGNMKNDVYRAFYNILRKIGAVDKKLDINNKIKEVAHEIFNNVGHRDVVIDAISDLLASQSNILDCKLLEKGSPKQSHCPECGNMHDVEWKDNEDLVVCGKSGVEYIIQKDDVHMATLSTTAKFFRSSWSQNILVDYDRQNFKELRGIISKSVYKIGKYCSPRNKINYLVILGNGVDCDLIRTHAKNSDCKEILLISTNQYERYGHSDIKTVLLSDVYDVTMHNNIIMNIATINEVLLPSKEYFSSRNRKHIPVEELQDCANILVGATLIKEQKISRAEFATSIKEYYGNRAQDSVINQIWHDNVPGECKICSSKKAPSIKQPVECVSAE